MALGPWATANPLPAGWAPTATCELVRADGCHAYDSDRRDRQVVLGSLAMLYSEAQQALSQQGFVVRRTPCTAPTDGTGACAVSGFRFRTLGGKDGESVSLIFRAIDREHATLVATVNAH